MPKRRTPARGRYCRLCLVEGHWGLRPRTGVMRSIPSPRHPQPMPTRSNRQGSHSQKNAAYFSSEVTCQSHSAVGVPSPLGISPSTPRQCTVLCQSRHSAQAFTVSRLTHSRSARAGNQSLLDVCGYTEGVRRPRIGRGRIGPTAGGWSGRYPEERAGRDVERLGA